MLCSIISYAVGVISFSFSNYSIYVSLLCLSRFISISCKYNLVTNLQRCLFVFISFLLFSPSFGHFLFSSKYFLPLISGDSSNITCHLRYPYTYAFPFSFNPSSLCPSLSLSFPPLLYQFLSLLLTLRTKTQTLPLKPIPSCTSCLHMPLSPSLPRSLSPILALLYSQGSMVVPRVSISLGSSAIRYACLPLTLSATH